MRVAVILGGVSKEREISLKSGRAVTDALKRRGHEVFEVDAQGLELVDALRNSKPEVVFIALHGKFGEDGTIQGLLESLSIPYTGPSVFTSALCFEKLATKQFLMPLGIPSPAYGFFEKGNDLKNWVAQTHLNFPLIVKPNTEGSTIGITRAMKREELAGAIEEALKFDRIVLVEEYIQGREVTVGVLDGVALPVVEVKPKGGFYDFQSKYTKGFTEYLVPAPLDASLTQTLSQLSEKVYRAVRCQGAVRMDYMIDGKNSPYFLEVNTIPGMTETSLLPKAAAAAGINFEDLCERVLKGALSKGGRCAVE